MLDGAAVDNALGIAARYHAEGGQPGLVVGLIAGGALVSTMGFGHRRLDGPAPDADTVFRIASMTKSFTAATLLLLRDQGALALDDPVARFVPELRDLPGPTTDSPPLTIRSLLTMSGGLPTDDPWGDRQQGLPDDEFAAFLRGGLSFTWAPGTAYEYSNLGFAILGRVVSQASGDEYRDAVTNLLLRPLDLTGTLFEADEVPSEHLAVGYRAMDGAWSQVPFDPYGAFAPMGGLFSSVRDLTRWVTGLADAFPPRDGPSDGHPLGRASRRELQQGYRVIPPRAPGHLVDALPSPRSAAYGFGLVVEYDSRFGPIVSHSGGYPGFGSHMRWHPGSGIGVVALANSTYALANLVGIRIHDALLDGSTNGPPKGFSSGRCATIAPVAGPAPSPGTVWPATSAARAGIDRLLIAWDDDEAARLFADNVDLDEPLDRRRAEVDRIRAVLGGLNPDPLALPESATAAHCCWWVPGPKGRLKVDMRLSPQVPARVQALTLTAVPHPSAGLGDLARLVVAAMAGPEPRWPDGVPLGSGLAPSRVARLVRAAAAVAGPCTVADVIAGDGERTATFRLVGERATLSLTLALDNAGEVRQVVIRT